MPTLGHKFGLAYLYGLSHDRDRRDIYFQTYFVGIARSVGVECTVAISEAL